MAMLTGEKLVTFVLDLLEEFVPALVADMLAQTWGKQRIDPTILARVKDLHTQGKLDEARKELHAHIGGLGLEDEQIQLTDLLVLKRVPRAGVGATQVDSLIASINGLTAHQKKRVRLAHVHESRQVRWENLIELAKLDDVGRRTMWNAAGLFEPGPEEQFDRAVREVNIYFAQIQAEQGAEQDRVRRMTGGQRFWHTLWRIITFSAVREAL